MSRKSLLLIAAALISSTAVTASNAFARPAGYGAMPVSKPQVSSLKSVSKLATPRATYSATVRQVASAHYSFPGQSAIDKAKAAAEKAAQDAKAGASGFPGQSAIDKIKAAVEKAAAEAQAKAAHDAALAHAKLQTPADPANKVGTQITPKPPEPPHDPHEKPKFPWPGGGVLIPGGPIVVESGPVIADSTITAPVVAATSRVVGTTTDRASPPRPTGPCNCLVKERLQDGSILFMDICTKESARSEPTSETTTR